MDSFWRGAGLVSARSNHPTGRPETGCLISNRTPSFQERSVTRHMYPHGIARQCILRTILLPGGSLALLASRLALRVPGPCAAATARQASRSGLREHNTGACRVTSLLTQPLSLTLSILVKEPGKKTA